MPILAREYESDADLRLMQELAAECWRLEGPFVDAHVGDLPWRMYQHLDKLREVRVRLWLDDTGRARAWAWLWQEGELDFQLHPASAGLLGEVLEWFESAAQPDEQGVIRAWTLEAHEQTVAALEAAGYELDDGSWYEHMLAPLGAEPPSPDVPCGFELRPVRGDDDVERRVEVHRAAFAPSRVVPESYRRVMRAWPYRPELDHVAVAPDGTFAASVCAGSTRTTASASSSPSALIPPTGASGSPGPSVWPGYGRYGPPVPRPRSCTPSVAAPQPGSTSR